MGRPAAFCKQTNKQTNKETSCTGTQRRALVAHVRVDYGRDALEAAVAEQRLDVQPISRVAEAAGIKASRTHHAAAVKRAACLVAQPESFLRLRVTEGRQRGSGALGLSRSESEARESGVGFRMCLVVPLPVEDAEEVLHDLHVGGMRADCLRSSRSAATDGQEQQRPQQPTPASSTEQPTRQSSRTLTDWLGELRMSLGSGATAIR